MLAPERVHLLCKSFAVWDQSSGQEQLYRHCRPTAGSYAQCLPTSLAVERVEILNEIFRMRRVEERYESGEIVVLVYACGI